MLFNRLSSGLTVGLDIGSSAIKLVELRERKGEYHLQRLGVEPLPPEAIVDGSIMDSSLVVDAIHRLNGRTNVKNDSYAISLSGHSVIIKKIQLPAMPREELAESIQWEAEQYIPFDINDVRLDYVVLTDGEPGRDNMEVLLVAVKRDKVNDYVSVVSQTGKTPTIVDVDVFAVQNAYEVSYAVDPRKVVALINMGAGVTNINILARVTTVFWRDISFGGHQFTEALQRELNLSFAQAETLKQGRSVGRYSLADARPVLDQVSAEVASEFRKTFDFFSATSLEGPVDELVLSGGGALTPNLLQVLRDRFEVPTELMNPLRRIKYKESDFDAAWLQSIAPMMTVAVGLAIREDDSGAGAPEMRSGRILQRFRCFVRDIFEPKEAPIPPADTPKSYEKDSSLRSEPAFPSVQRLQDQPPSSAEKKHVASTSPAPLSPAVPRPPAELVPQRATLEGKIFISYAREDLESARRLYNELCTAGLTVWLDRVNLLGGERWRPAIAKAIRASDFFIALLSTSGSSRRSEHHKEIRQALEIHEQTPESHVFIIPVRLDDCEPGHSALLELQWIDLFPDWDEGLEKILRALEERVRQRRGRNA